MNKHSHYYHKIQTKFPSVYRSFLYLILNAYMYICTAHISIIFSYIINLEKLIHKILFFIYIFTYTADFFSDYSPSGLNTSVAHQAPLCPWDFRGKNIGVGCHFLLQGIFPNPRSNQILLFLLHWLTDSLPLYHLEIPNISYSSA